MIMAKVSAILCAALAVGKSGCTRPGVTFGVGWRVQCATRIPIMSRSALLAKVHVAKKQLRLDDDTYRDLLARTTGQRSAAGLTDRQLVAVLDALKAAGWQAPASKAMGKPHVAKVLALWADMCAQGIPRDASDAALTSFVKRMTGIDRIEWLTVPPASKVIEGLKAWRARELSRRERA
jgi:phage gp16-like protein